MLYEIIMFSFSQGIDINKIMVPGQKLYSLPFDVVLNNNVALSYFIGKLSDVPTWPLDYISIYQIVSNHACFCSFI